MTSRSKWSVTINNEERISENRISSANNINNNIDRQTILELIDSNSLTTHFQPIFSSKDGAVYGYEALTRIKDDNKINIGDLFRKAILTNTISSLDVKCRENAISLASYLGISRSRAYLFINVCPEALMDPAHSVRITDELAEDFGISKDNIILEINEESAIHNCNLFTEVVTYYKKSGYKIAIDDFGAGYGGLKMLSIVANILE